VTRQLSVRILLESDPSALDGASNARHVRGHRTSRGRGRRARFPLGLRAVVFQVADGRITAVTEYCDTTAMKRILFAA
jgi:ketosteroid isomerase-like protein